MGNAVSHKEPGLNHYQVEIPSGEEKQKPHPIPSFLTNEVMKLDRTKDRTNLPLEGGKPQFHGPYPNSRCQPTRQKNCTRGSPKHGNSSSSCNSWRPSKPSATAQPSALICPPASFASPSQTWKTIPSASRSCDSPGIASLTSCGFPPDLKKPIPASHWTGNGIPGDVPWTAEAGGRSGVWGSPPQAYGKFATATLDPPRGAIVRRPPVRPLDKEGGRGFADKCTAQGSDGGVFGAARAVGSFRNVDFLATGAGNWCGLLGMPSSCEPGGCHEWVGLGSTDRSKRAWVHPGWPAGPASDARVFAFWGGARGTSGGVGTPASPGGQPGATGEVLWGAAADDGMGARLLSEHSRAGTQSLRCRP